VLCLQLRHQLAGRGRLSVHLLLQLLQCCLVASNLLPQPLDGTLLCQHLLSLGRQRLLC
jgi:hypothetical protein